MAIAPPPWPRALRPAGHWSRERAIERSPKLESAGPLRWIAAWLLAGGGDWGKPTGFERRDGNF